MILNDKKIRLFIAIELPKTVQKEIHTLQNALKKTYQDIKWVNPQNIHLTLKFLGYVEKEKIGKIIECLNKLTKEFNAFNISLDRKINAFPEIKYPRVLWVGIDEGKDKVIRINQRLEDELEKIDFKKEEREFTPHLTIARIKNFKSKQGLIDKLTTLSLEKEQSFNVSKLTLFKSTLTRKGPIYEIEYEVSLE